MRVRKVYFNSTCPVCNAGVTRQRVRMESAAAGCDIEWRDINDDPAALAHRGVSIEHVRRKLYVEDECGALHIGAEAFAALWSETPRQRWRGRLLRMPGFAALARWGYDAFAAALYAWNRHKRRW